MSQNRRTILPVIFILASMLSMNAISKDSKDKPAKPMRSPDVVYVGTAYDLVSKMLEMAKVKKDDLVYDLGCGDGRMLVLAAQKYGCHAVGYDIDPVRVEESIANATRNHVEKLVKIIEADIFTVDIKDADVIPMYLLPEMNRKLLPQLDTLKKGARIVTHDYDLDGIVADKTITVISNEDNASHILSLYTTPLKRK
jgi:ribosomal protein L11 methylase PrmA